MVTKTELRKLIGEGKLVYGSERVLKSIRHGNVKRVILSSNAPAPLKQSLARYQQLGNFTLELAELSNDELGTACKKPFSISALAILS